MMRAQLDDAHERGEPIAALWASDEPIYGRYGYGLASLAGEIELPRTHAEFAPRSRIPARSATSSRATCRRCSGRSGSTSSASGRGCSRARREWWKSRIAYDPPQWRRGAGPKRFAVVELGGNVAGYAIYRHDPKWEGGVPDAGKVAVRRGARPLARGRDRALALPPRHRVGRRGLRAAAPARPSALVDPRRAAADEDARRRRALGAAARRRRGALGSLVLRAGPIVFQVAGRLLLRGTPAAGSSRTASRRRRARTPISRCDVDSARLGLPRRLHVRASSCAADASRS